MLRIGLTYDLKDDHRDSGLDAEDMAEFDSPQTIDGLEGAIRSLGHGVVRIGHVRNLAARLVAGERWDLVFNIAEGLSGMGREAQVPCLLDAYGVPYVFSDPLVLALCLHKGLTKRVVRDAGIATADFAVVQEPDEIDGIDLPFPLFVKPVAEGTGKGVSGASKVEGREALGSECRRLLERFRQPVLVETFLPGREFTVGLTGTGRRAEVIGCMEVLYGRQAEGQIYSYDNKIDYERRISYTAVRDDLARRACDEALAAYRLVGCRDGGRVDMRVDSAGRPAFIEINPLAGLNPEHSDLPILARLFGLSYRDLVARILASALARLA